MSDFGGNMSCKRGCWWAALVAGVLTAILLWAVWSWGFFPGLLVGIIVGVIAGFLLNWFLCSDQDTTSASQAHSGHSTSDAGASSSSTSAAAPAAAAAATTAAAASEQPPASEPVSETPAAPVKAAETPAKSAPSEPLIKPSKALAGEADLAERKGDWKYEGEAKPAKPAAKPKAAKAKACLLYTSPSPRDS